MDEAHQHDRREHTVNDVWRVVNEHGRSIGTLQTGLARIESRFEGGFNQLSSQLQSFGSTMDRVVDRTNRPADVKGWIAIGFSLLLILGSIGLTTIMPVSETTRINATEVRELSKEVNYALGFAKGSHQEIDTQIDSLIRRVERLEDAP